MKWPFLVVAFIIESNGFTSIQPFWGKRQGKWESFWQHQYPRGLLKQQQVQQQQAVTVALCLQKGDNNDLEEEKDDNEDDNGNKKKKKKKKSNNKSKSDDDFKKSKKWNNNKKSQHGEEQRDEKTAKSNNNKSVNSLPKQQQQQRFQKKKKKKQQQQQFVNVVKQRKKEIVAEEWRRQQSKQTTTMTNKSNKKKKQSNLLEIVNPFRVGKEFRKTLESLKGISEETRSIYLDDRLGLGLSERNPKYTTTTTTTTTTSSTSATTSSSSSFIPEVLVVGATGQVGRLVVRQLLLQGGFRVRVLVRNIYTPTLDMLGTGVTYCQGDLRNVESLEYALTDVDKIVFCASAAVTNNHDSDEETRKRLQWAEQVDCIGMKNLVSAYQNVRFADYGPSQTTKRTLFNFKSRPEDFYIFALEQDQDVNKENDDTNNDDQSLSRKNNNNKNRRWSTNVRMQCGWIKNDYGLGVFVGKVPRNGGEASIVSSPLKSRSSSNDDQGLDFSAGGFAGLIVRLCADGNNYEAFIRTGTYETHGIEYVCPFQTHFKQQNTNNNNEDDDYDDAAPPKNKFSTLRLGFQSFLPVQRQRQGDEESLLDDNQEDTLLSLPPFTGQDVRYIGFRYRANANNDEDDNDDDKRNHQDYSSFYMALHHIKVYRGSPDPEIIYLSDARIPPKVSNTMIRHDLKQLEASPPLQLESDGASIMTEHDLLQTANRMDQETYFKYRGEEILKNSGLNYAIIRVSGYNDVKSGETSAIELTTSNDSITKVSRADVAQVCVKALLDPLALNKSFYMSRKKKATALDEDISSKFKEIPADMTP